MNSARFFVTQRAVAWTALVGVLIWGVLAYRHMPKRQDPEMPALVGAVVTAYPGIPAPQVAEEVTRKVARALTDHPQVSSISGESYDGLSVVFVELQENLDDTEHIWQELRARLNNLTDLPTLAGQPLRPYLDKDFGRTVAIMLTLVSPPIHQSEILLRSQGIRQAIQGLRAQAHDQESTASQRLTAVLIFPQDQVPASLPRRWAQSFLQELTDRHLIADGQVAEQPGLLLIDFHLPVPTNQSLVRQSWDQLCRQLRRVHPDIGPGLLIREPQELTRRLSEAAPDRYSFAQLEEAAKLLRDRLAGCETIGRIDLIGVQRRQVTLLYSAQRLDHLGLTPVQLMERIRQHNANLPAPELTLVSQEILVRPAEGCPDAPALARLPVAVSPQGFALHLGDLVEIVDGYEDPPNVLNLASWRCDDSASGSANTSHAPHRATSAAPNPAGRLQHHRAITLALYQAEGTQINQLDQQVRQVLAQVRPLLPTDLDIRVTWSQPEQVRRKLTQFNRCFTEALIIVVTVALILMEWRSAVMVAVSIPLAVAMTLGICQALGLDIQQVSLGALIIALGMLVDDPVVAADAINRELAAGRPRQEAAWTGPQKLARAILYATLTNIAAFLPLLLVGGAIGKYIYSLPVVVAAALASSRIVSMTFMPLLGFYLLKGQKGLEDQPPGRLGGYLSQSYQRLTFWAMSHRRSLLLIAMTLLALGTWAARQIGTAFFPMDHQNLFSVGLYLPAGTSLDQTARRTQELVQQIDQLVGNEVQGYTSFIGSGSPRFAFSIVPQQRQDHYAQILIHVADARQTDRLAQFLRRELPGRFAAGHLRIEQIQTGPPIGLPVQIRIWGSDPQVLRQLGDQVATLMRHLPGACDIQDDWGKPVFRLPLQIDDDRAALAGLSRPDLAQSLYTALAGQPITQIRQNDRLIDVVLRLEPRERSQPADVLNLAVTGLTGQRVMVRQVLSAAELQAQPPRLVERDLDYCLTVQCDATSGQLPSRLVEQLRPQLAHLAWPASYRYEFAGEDKEQRKGFAAVRLALIVSLLGIYLLLVVQFNSLIQPLLVFAAVPFGMLAGVLALWLLGLPFGFMAFLGIASLAGVIVSHMIVLFDFVQEARQQGLALRQALVRSGLVRLRPVLVSVLTTIGGLVPLALWGGPLWLPMCTVLIAGLLLATAVTLLLVPLLYVLFVEDLRILR